MRALQLLALPALLDPAVSTLHDDAPALRGVPPTTLAPPLPPWAGTYEMRQSTIAMPCNQSGWFDADIGASYGLVSYDCKCSNSLADFMGSGLERPARAADRRLRHDDAALDQLARDREV